MYKPSPQVVIDKKESLQLHDIFIKMINSKDIKVFSFGTIYPAGILYIGLLKKKKKALDCMFIKMIVRKGKGIFFRKLLNKKISFSGHTVKNSFARSSLSFLRVVSLGSLYPVSCFVAGILIDSLFYPSVCILFIALFKFFVNFDDFRSNLRWACIRFG